LANQQAQPQGQGAYNKQKGGFLSELAGWQKIILVLLALGAFFLIFMFIFGGIKDLYQLIFFVISFVGCLAIGVIVINAVVWFLTPQMFSAKKDFHNRLKNIATDLKPDNVFDLYFRGSIDKKRVHAGKIVGLMGIPYLVGDPVLNDDGTPKMVFSQRLKKEMPVYSNIQVSHENGDTLFVYENGFFIFKKTHYLRCHKSLHGDLHGDIEIYDINPMPYGGFFEYPFLQYQQHIAQIMMQNQLEIIIATHDYQHDLISQSVDSAIYFNPYFRLLQKTNAEIAAGGAEQNG